jgi:hypothetical protein
MKGSVLVVSSVLAIAGLAQCSKGSEISESSSTQRAALEPTVGDEIDTGEPVVSALLNQGVSAVAADGANYLVVFSGQNPDLYAARVSRSGEVLDPFGIAIAPGGPRRTGAKVSWTGDHYFVVWQEESAVDTGLPENRLDVRGARVSREGTVLDPNGFDIAIGGMAQHRPEVAAGGAVSLVVWLDGRVIEGQRHLRAARVDDSRTVLDSAPLALAENVGEQSAISVGHAASSFLVTWQLDTAGSNGFQAIVVGEDGSIGNAFTVQAEGARNAAIGSDGTQFLVAWEKRNITWDEANVFAARISTAGVMLDPQGFAVSPANTRQSVPEVAFAGDRFFVTWNVVGHLGGDDEGADVHARMISTAGVPLGAAIPVATQPLSQSGPRLAGASDQLLAAWSDLGAGRRAFAARISADGTVLDPNGFIAATGANEQRDPAVAFNGEVYLAVWFDSRGQLDAANHVLWATRLSASGELLDPEGIRLAEVPADPNVDSRPLVAPLGSTFVVVWNHLVPPYLRAVRVGADGAVRDPAPISIAPNEFWQRRPAITSDGARALVVWEEGHAQTFFDIAGAFVTADSVGSPFDIARHDNEELRPAVASNGNEFLVAWEHLPLGGVHDGVVRAARIDATGAVLNPDGNVIADQPIRQTDLELAWAGDKYLLVASASSASGLFNDIYATRVSATAEPLDDQSFVIGAADSKNDTQPAVVGLDTDFLVAWLSDGIRGATVSNGPGAPAVSPFTIDTAIGTRVAIAGTGQRALTLYDDTSGRTPRVAGRFVNLGATPPDGGPPDAEDAGSADSN